MSYGTRNYLWISLLVVLLIAAPVVFGVVALLWIVYWYRLGGKQKNAQLVDNLQSIRSTTLLLALALTLLTLAMHSTVDQVTQFGFPAPVITYYNRSTDAGFPSSWAALISTVAVNPLRAIVNCGIYLFLLLVLNKLRQRPTRI